MTAARSMGDWQLALMIAGRYSGYEKKSDITTRSESGNDTLSKEIIINWILIERRLLICQI